MHKFTNKVRTIRDKRFHKSVSAGLDEFTAVTITALRLRL